MAGLYIHIPFCRNACTYCDFHFSVSLGHLPPMLKAIEKEIQLRQHFLEGETIRTIYFGGGTPSLLEPARVTSLLKAIRENYAVDEKAEITLEANPDDLNPEYLSALRQIGINRLSIGIQSFDDRFLKLMNRRHTSAQAGACLDYARKAGFDNLNLDLIYGLPGLSIKKWGDTLDVALSYRPAHLAAYHLSYEPGSVLDYRRRKGKIKPVDENRSLEHFRILLDRMEDRGYQHYEISNFALPGFLSRHNSAYWKSEKYLGIGPSAHSYNGRARQWNMAKNSSYIRGIMAGEEVGEQEVLNEKTRLNEYLMTSLRTMWGTDTEYIGREWGKDSRRQVLDQAKPFIQGNRIINKGNILVLSREGMFIADHIISKLFL
jgi:oxygen-independent coproporphyrinogen-3 oxidase